MHVYKYKIQRDGTGLQGAVLGGVYRQHIGADVYKVILFTEKIKI